MNVYKPVLIDAFLESADLWPEPSLALLTAVLLA